VYIVCHVFKTKKYQVGKLQGYVDGEPSLPDLRSVSNFTNLMPMIITIRGFFSTTPPESRSYGFFGVKMPLPQNFLIIT